MSLIDSERNRASELLAQARKIAHDFDFPAADVRRATTHFLKQLSKSSQLWVVAQQTDIANR